MQENESYQTERLISFYKEEMTVLRNRFSIWALRPKFLPSSEAYFQGDVDFLILKEEFQSIFEYLYERCKNAGINFRFIQKFPNKKKFHFFIDDYQTRSITMEFWTAIEFTKNKKLHTFEAQSIFDAINNQSLLKAEAQSLIYLTHLYHKQKDIFSDENTFRFGVFLNRLKEEKKTPTTDKITDLLQKVQKQETTLEQANRQAVELLTVSGVSRQKAPFPVFNLYRKALWNKVFHLHRLIPVVGPDGVGKGIVSANSLKSFSNWTDFRFKDLYRMRIFYKHIVLRFFNPKNLKKNKLDEKLGYYIFILASLSIHILPIYLRGKKVLLDRYFLDYYATPIRYLQEGQKPQKLKGYPTMFYLTPVPDKMIFMGCQNQSLIARKNELPQTAVNYLQQLYIQFILKKRIPEILFISTENEVEVSVKAMQSFMK